MPAPLCTPHDVGAWLGTSYQEDLPEHVQVAKLCGAVSALIRARRPQIDTWLAAGSIDDELVRSIAVQVVCRNLTTIATGGVGLRSETHPEHSYELTASAAAGLNLTKAELTALTPVAGRDRPFSIIPR
jgi:hypothetical protein